MSAMIVPISNPIKCQQRSWKILDFHGESAMLAA